VKGGGILAIRYDKLFALLKERNITKYQLRKEQIIGTETLEKMRKNKGNIDTRSIEKLCKYLNIQPGDIMEFIPDADGNADND
jgi:DNA-binding Xre family transcriptional regulator